MWGEPYLSRKTYFVCLNVNRKWHVSSLHKEASHKYIFLSHLAHLLSLHQACVLSNSLQEL